MIAAQGVAEEATMSMPNETRPQADQPIWKRFTTKQIIAMVIAVVALVAILQNTRDAHFNILWFDFQAPTWLWMVALFGAGLLTGILLARRRARKDGA